MISRQQYVRVYQIHYICAKSLKWHALQGRLKSKTILTLFFKMAINMPIQIFGTYVTGLVHPTSMWLLSHCYYSFEELNSLFSGLTNYVIWEPQLFQILHTIFPRSMGKWNNPNPIIKCCNNSELLSDWRQIHILQLNAESCQAFD